ncbi:tetratricopeptide repeat-containing diguanylate cyclase [Massilia horti]|uniref:diguanylate cyclase n=1 Tax=Massilia horti TaxID=2562153 RepID=A0A4Y9SPL6_9BURK|nr:GGDEF domain-containing protein [Massilia horti]TFW28501.1 GGDEF domain-containing protein [Massilia horti]
MFAALKETLQRRRQFGLLVSLCLAIPATWAAAPSLSASLAEARELNRFFPERALPMLLEIEPQARAAPPAERAEFLAQLCSSYLGAGKHEHALATCDELIEYGRANKDKVALAKGLLRKGYVEFALNELPLSHKLIWESEQLANTTNDIELRVRAIISSGQSYAEDGNFPLALAKLQAAALLARENGDPIQIVMAQNALAKLYRQLREYNKGFEALAEAHAAAERSSSPGRMSTLLNTEYGLAMDSGQQQRALKAMLSSLALERKIGSPSRIAHALANLSNCYLKLHNYTNAASYAQQTIAAAKEMNNERLVAVARMNLGLAYLGKGRLAEGKRNIEAGLALFEKAGSKPDLQTMLVDYGDALERAGDLNGALTAYHRERALSNELFETRRQKAMLELQEKYEADKKERQIELLMRENQVNSAEIKNRRLQLRVWGLVVVVFALTAIIVWFLYRKVRHANARLHEKNLELKQQSVRDPLTGLYNRRHFQEFIRNYHHTEKRGSGTTGEDVVGALFLLDVDHFKNINDTWGHAVGDVVLNSIAQNLRDILRETDMIVRWGGEEFLAFLPAIPRSGLDEVARRLLSGIASTQIEVQGEKLAAQVSIGFAPFPLALRGEALSWERAVNLVDMALYLAKGHGRNRAYGVRAFSNFEQTSLEEIEQDLERAWRSGYVDLSIVLCGWQELRVMA